MVDLLDITCKLIIFIMLPISSFEKCTRETISETLCRSKLNFPLHNCNWNTGLLQCVKLNFNLTNKYLNYNGNSADQLMEIINGIIPLELTSGLFRPLSELIYIGIHRNNISFMEPGVFNSLPKLITLNISNNFINTLPDGVFNSLYSLSVLDLSGNRIHEIKETSLLGMHSLKELYLSNNYLYDMLPTLASCETLTRLDLSTNGFESLSPLSGCTNLEYFDISHCYIKNFTEDIFEIPPLTYLDMSYNELDYIEGDNLRHLFTLRTLNFSGNPLFAINDPPIDLFQYTKSLIALNLSSTSIRRLGVGTFSRLQTLQVLDLSRNNLSYLPKGLFHDLTYLRELYINDNQLSYFQINYFITLTQIDLNRNLWNCENLASIINNRKNTLIIRGNTYSRTNVYGIGCQENFKDYPNVQEFNTSNLNSLQKEYLSYIAKSQDDMRKAIINLKDALVLININKTNQSATNWNEQVVVAMKNLINETSQNQKYYQDTFQKQQLDLQKILFQIINTTETSNLQKNITQFLNNTTYLKDIKNIVGDLKDALVQSNFIQTNYSNEYLKALREGYQSYSKNIQEDITNIMVDIRNTLLTQKGQTTQPVGFDADADRFKMSNYEPRISSGSDTAALYCIFVVLLVILTMVAILFFVYYRKNNRFRREVEELNPLDSINA